MCKWFKRDDNKASKPQVNNYKIDDKGNIEIRVFSWVYNIPIELLLSKESIISQSNENIVFKRYQTFYNHQTIFPHGFPSPTYLIDYTKTIEKKENFITYKETKLETYEHRSNGVWNLINTDVIGKEITLERTPQEVFEKEFKSKYKLIDTMDEFNDYLSSALDCNTWCRKKLYDKMKELGLGDGFINQFADLIGNDLNKYYAMIDLATEVTDKDTLMYLYTYKFQKN